MTVTALPAGRFHDDLPPRSARDWVTTNELVADTGISYRQADYWTRTGLLMPLGEPSPGSGYQRHYPTDQVCRAAVVSALLHAGFSLVGVRRIIDTLLLSEPLGLFTVTTETPTGTITIDYQPTPSPIPAHIPENTP